ncbi:MAG: GNAT family N-acetyltransferase [Bacteroidales bacterium]|nr:GNAT family N-acetyltransferase [Bacteroidales bacterium]
MENIRLKHLNFAQYQSEITSLLTENHLPVNDLDSGLRYFIGAFSDEKLTGFAALEGTGDYGLFRSLVVSEEFRSSGIGKKIHDALLTHSLVEGFKKLYLLTTTADTYFAKQGWIVVQRDTVPDSIKKTEEFSSICPSAAVCMEFNLPLEKQEIAGWLFKAGFNCAQSVFLPFALELGMKPEHALKLTTGFGAGMVYRGETCGAVTGAMMAIGLLYGRNVAADTGARDKTYDLINRYYKDFKNINGSILCKELLKVDLSTDEGKMEANHKGLFENLCPKLIRDSVILSGEILKKA